MSFWKLHRIRPKKCVSSDTFFQLIILRTVNTAHTCAWVLIRESFDQFRKSSSEQTYIYRMQWLCKKNYFDSRSFFLKLNVKLWVCTLKLTQQIKAMNRNSFTCWPSWMFKVTFIWTMNRNNFTCWPSRMFKVTYIWIFPGIYKVNSN